MDSDELILKYNDRVLKNKKTDHTTQDFTTTIFLCKNLLLLLQLLLLFSCKYT